MKRDHVEIVARSIFLQGLLLMEPAAMETHFQAVAAVIRRFQTVMHEMNRTPIEGALAFLAQTGLVDVALVGVTTLEEWRAIAQAFQHLQTLHADWDSFAFHDERILNPSLWPAAVRS